jgi:hypothetical protein
MNQCGRGNVSFLPLKFRIVWAICGAWTILQLLAKDGHFPQLEREPDRSLSAWRLYAKRQRRFVRRFGRFRSISGIQHRHIFQHKPVRRQRMLFCHGLSTIDFLW